mmetsp:Transcript_11459/g.14723  ORF Transcript_11459/g.14723 Transcript_11459/m.14723 type:complete len:111 (-) Transcript_11459:1073-1405(-)
MRIVRFGLLYKTTINIQKSNRIYNRNSLILIITQIFKSLPCLLSHISILVGWVMTGLAAISKVPQIRTMLEMNSSTGLSTVAVYTETFMYCCSVSYFIHQDLYFDDKIDQ